MTLKALAETVLTRSQRHSWRLADSWADARLTGQKLCAMLWTGRDVRSQTGRAALAAFAIRVGSAGLLYLSQIAMARWMGSFEYGIYVFAWTWVLVLGGLAPAGLGLSIIRLLPEHLTVGETAKARGILRYGRLFALGTSTLLAISAAVCLYAFGEWIVSDHYRLALFLAVVCIPMYALGDVHDGIGRGQGWMVEGLLAPYILRPLILLAVIAVAYAAGWPATGATAAIAAIVATWASTGIQFIMVQARIDAVVPKGPLAVDFAKWRAVSVPLVAIGACEMLLQYADVLIISRYVQPDQVGIYFAAAKTMALMLFVHYAVGSAVANRFAALSASGDRKALAQAVKDAVTWTFWPSLLAAVAILALGKPMLWLFGPSFTDGYAVMFVLVLGYLARAATGPSDFLLNMAGEQTRSAAVLVIAAIVNVALNLALVPDYGLFGAASATAASLTLAAVMHAYIVWRRLGFRMWIGG